MSDNKILLFDVMPKNAHTSYSKKITKEGKPAEKNIRINHGDSFPLDEFPDAQDRVDRKQARIVSREKLKGSTSTKE